MIRRRLTLLFIALAIAGCAEEGGIGGTGSVVFDPVDVSGSVNKGPYSSGGQVNAQSLSGNFTASANISDTLGNYQIELGAGLAWRLSATGRWFDEVNGSEVAELLELTAVIVASPGSGANINVATHLSRARIDALVEDGITVGAAIDMARDELVLALSPVLPAPSGPIDFNELLLINAAAPNGVDEEGNAWLLALSATVLAAAGENTAGFIDNLASEFAEDGTLGAGSIDALVSASTRLDADAVHQNLLAIDERFQQSALRTAGDFDTSELDAVECRVFGARLLCLTGPVPDTSFSEATGSGTDSDAPGAPASGSLELESLVADMNRFLDTDRDGVVNANDDDDDNDGIPDAEDVDPYDPDF